MADPSALIGSFSTSDIGFVFPNLFQSISTDSTNWKASRQTWESKLEFLTDLGINGAAPFGQKAGIDSDANFLWSEGGSGVRYFTMALHPTNSTARRFTVGVQPEFNSIEGILTKTEGVPNSIAYEDGPSRALAIAYPGRVGAKTEETLAQGPGDLLTGSWAEYDSPDFILTTTGSETSAEISLNFVMKGTMIGGAGKGGLPVEKSIATSQVDVYAQVNNESLLFIRGTLTARHEVGTETPGTEVTAVDLFNRDLFPAVVEGDAGDYAAEYNVIIDKMFTTPTYTIQVGVPFSVKLSNTLASSAKSDTGKAVSINDFTGEVSFPTQGPVFNVPEGFTVNSISGTVRDNQFEGEIVPAFEKVLVPGLFMQAGDIEGESQTKGREDWIELQDVSSGLFRLVQGRSRQTAIYEDVVVTKYIDKSTPKLAEALAQGTVLEKVIIAQNNQIAEDLWRRFEFHLSNVQVTEFQISGQTIESLPLESVSLNYEKIDWIHELCNSQGEGQGRVEANWDLVTDTGGSSSSSGDNEPPSMEPVTNQSVDPATTNFVNLVLDDMETNSDDLEVTVSTSRPDLIGELVVTGTGSNRQLSFKTSALFSGFASIVVTVSDGKDTRTTAIPVLSGIEMTPYEGYLAAYFTEEEMFNPKIASPILDPDKDGIATIIEYLLGTNPTEANRASEAITISNNGSGLGRFFKMKFRKRLDDPNIQGYLWGSFNLKDWVRLDSSNPLYEESTEQGENPLFEEVSGTVTPPPGTEPFFIRYQVQDVF
jgi:type VI secretion system secreted protein Hcp